MKKSVLVFLLFVSSVFGGGLYNDGSFFRNALSSPAFVGFGMYARNDVPEPILSVTNAQKLSLDPVSTPVGKRVSVTDGFVVSGLTDDLATANGFWFPSGADSFSTPGRSGDWNVSRDGGTGKWAINNNLISLLSVDTDKTNPWSVIEWEDSGGNGTPTLTHPAIQQLAAPSTAQGGVFVSGGTQDGVYAIGGVAHGKNSFGLLGTTWDQASQAITWDNDFGDFAWRIFDNTGNNPLCYSLSDVATPDLAGTDKVVMEHEGAVMFYTDIFNGKKRYVGGTKRVFWRGSVWAVTDNSVLDPTVFASSEDDTETPDLADFVGGNPVNNVAWINAADDSPADITVTSVTQGELDAGRSISGATGILAVNGAWQQIHPYLNRFAFRSITSPDYWSFWDDEGWAIQLNNTGTFNPVGGQKYFNNYGPTGTRADFDPSYLGPNLPAPDNVGWGSNTTGLIEDIVFTRNDVASEANWEIVTP